MNTINKSLGAILNDYIELSIEKATTTPDVERQCEICRDAFSVDIHSTARICPECLRRLERMLYPERND